MSRLASLNTELEQVTSQFETLHHQNQALMATIQEHNNLRRTNVQRLPFLSHVESLIARIDEHNIIRRDLVRRAHALLLESAEQVSLETVQPSSAPPPITKVDKTQLESIPFYRSLLLQNKKMEDTCPICRDSFVVGGSVTRLPCDHYFCAPCVAQWLDMSRTCPVCRLELSDVAKLYKNMVCDDHVEPLLLPKPSSDAEGQSDVLLAVPRGHDDIHDSGRRISPVNGFYDAPQPQSTSSGSPTIIRRSNHRANELEPLLLHSDAPTLVATVVERRHNRVPTRLPSQVEATRPALYPTVDWDVIQVDESLVHTTGRRRPLPRVSSSSSIQPSPPAAVRVEIVRLSSQVVLVGPVGRIRSRNSSDPESSNTEEGVRGRRKRPRKTRD